MRYRLIPTRGIRERATHFFADSDEEAEYLAQREAVSRQLLLCRAPIDGLVREVCIVGEQPAEPKPRKR